MGVGRIANHRLRLKSNNPKSKKFHGAYIRYRDAERRRIHKIINASPKGRLWSRAQAESHQPLKQCDHSLLGKSIESESILHQRLQSIIVVDAPPARSHSILLHPSKITTATLRPVAAAMPKPTSMARSGRTRRMSRRRIPMHGSTARDRARKPSSASSAIA